jgi:hypothetical protein
MLTNQLFINCSNSTTRREFKRSSLHGHKKTKKPLLQIRHRKARLTFAEKYVDWTVEDWRRVLWSDETKMCLFGPDEGDWMWKNPKEVLNKCTSQSTVKYGGGNIMVWWCFAWAGTGMLIEVERRMKADQYMDILEAGVISSFEKLEIKEKNRIFQHVMNCPKIELNSGLLYAIYSRIPDLLV